MKRLYLLIISLVILGGCNNVEKVLDEMGAPVQAKLEAIDLLIPVIENFSLNQRSYGSSNRAISNENCAIINLEQFPEIYDFNYQPDCYGLSTNILLDIQTARVALEMEMANYPQELMSVLGLGLNYTFEDLMTLEYLLVIDEFQYLAPEYVAPVAEGESPGFRPGHIRGAVMLFDIEEREFLGAAPFSAESSPVISLPEPGEDGENSAEECINFIELDFSTQLWDAFKATVKENFPKQTLYH